MVSFAHKKPRKLAVGIIINPAMATCPWQPRLRIAMATKVLRSIAMNLIRRPIGTGVTNLSGNGPGFVSGIYRPQPPVRDTVASWQPVSGNRIEDKNRSQISSVAEITVRISLLRN